MVFVMLMQLLTLSDDVQSIVDSEPFTIAHTTTSSTDFIKSCLEYVNVCRRSLGFSDLVHPSLWAELFSKLWNGFGRWQPHEAEDHGQREAETETVVAVNGRYLNAECLPFCNFHLQEMDQSNSTNTQRLYVQLEQISAGQILRQK